MFYRLISSTVSHKSLISSTDTVLCIMMGSLLIHTMIGSLLSKLTVHAPCKGTASYAVSLPYSVYTLHCNRVRHSFSTLRYGFPSLLNRFEMCAVTSYSCISRQVNMVPILLLFVPCKSRLHIVKYHLFLVQRHVDPTHCSTCVRVSYYSAGLCYARLQVLGINYYTLCNQ